LDLTGPKKENCASTITVHLYLLLAPNKDASMISFDSEKSLEDFIFSYHQKTGLFVFDKEKYDICLRQVNLGGYGIADLVFVDLEWSNGPDSPIFHFNIVELKNDKARLKDFSQVCRYRTGIQNMMSTSYGPMEFFIYSTLLVKKGLIEDVDASFLSANIENFFAYEFDIDNENLSVSFSLFDHVKLRNFKHSEHLKKLMSPIYGFIDGA
tara:strand:+ start:5133 stop:5762 length:630 start_codon:yes stop_codon:yes gene_type:complete